MEKISLTTPLTDDIVLKLRVGQQVLINGKIFTGRDAAHKKLVELLEMGEKLPVDLTGQIIYYVGPTPPKPNQIIGAAGPTTAGRMDVYTPKILEQGLKGMIGKGKRSLEVIEAMKKHKAVYFAAIGGAAAYISKTVKSANVVAYPELGPEAIYQLEVVNLPVIVVNDAYGGDLYEEGISKYTLT
ncbi:MAG: Fe-S-containing hydro-lyase [Desulfotomaculum sp.]|nr:Fe-S-containing hydro-lyase [Desulfotomaculum sp.]